MFSSNFHLIQTRVPVTPEKAVADPEGVKGSISPPGLWKLVI